MYVSVSAYDDARVLDGCLASVREVLPGATVEVVDGAYETWPEGGANSGGEVRRVANDHGAAYLPEGPFDTERDKHVARVDRAAMVTGAAEGATGIARGEPYALFMDADERLTAFDRDRLPDGRPPLRPRIHNPVVYGNRVAYWPRLFDPADVAAVHRWDKYEFDVDERVQRTDAVTITHRHDLRPAAYRERKLQRLENEGRSEAAFYAETPEAYVGLDLGAEVRGDCPECGRHAVVRSPATPFADLADGWLSFAECCIAADCYRSTGRLQVGEWEYLPDEWPRAFEAGAGDDAVRRLRRELVDAGMTMVAAMHYEALYEMVPAIKHWVDKHLDADATAETEVFPA